MSTHRADETHRTDESVDRPARTRVADREDSAVDQDVTTAREHEAYGGVKIGAAFFGWLVAVGIGVLLTALVAATGTAIGLATDGQVNVEDADAQTVGIVGAVLVLVIMFIAYYAGGYVAGRMARFDGAKQGLAVFGWAIVMAILVALLAWAVGAEYNLLLDANIFPRLPVDEGTLTTAGVITALVWLLASLGAAILGGLAGVRYHRKVDAAGYDR